MYSVDFMVDSAQLGFLGEHGGWGPRDVTGAGADCGLCSLVSDRDRNLMVYMYLPEGECPLHPLLGRGVGHGAGQAVT